MEIKIVKKPLQDEYTKPEELEHVEIDSEQKQIIPKWCVKTYRYSEKFGGLNKWFEEIEQMEKKGANVMYLYNIESMIQGIVMGVDVEGKPMVEDAICYYIRADYKIK